MTDRDPIDELLAREPYREDDGFTARVLERLPPRRRDRRAIALGLAAAAAAAAGAFSLPMVGRDLAALAAWWPPLGLPASAAALLLGLAAAATAAAVALFPE